MGALFRMGALMALLALLGQAVAHAQEPVDLELALAVDVSGSIDDEEAQLQRDGYVAAFRDPGVIRAIEQGMLGRIAVAYYEWSGYGQIRVIVGWTLIENEKTAHAFASRLTLEPPRTVRRTSISSAIDFALPFFERNKFDGARRVVDVSGDGANNSGELVTDARDRVIAAGVTINGLPIMNGRLGPFGWPPIPDLDLYYENCVIGGPGAFLVVANGFGEFAEAVRRKLILEIAGRLDGAIFDVAHGDLTVRRGADHRSGPLGGARPAPGRGPESPFLMPAQVTAERIPPPCDIGERRMRAFEDN